MDNLRHTVTDKPWTAAVTRDGNVARFIAAGGTETEVIVGDGHLGLERPPTILQRRITNSTVYGNAVDISGTEGGYVKSAECEGSVKDGYGLLKIETARGTDLCFASYRPGSHKVGDLVTDAQQAFVMRDGDNVRAMYLGGGTMLQVGKALIGRDKPGLAYLEKAETGAYILGNPSPTECKVTVDFAPLNTMRTYQLDHKGRRVKQVNLASDAAGSYQLSMAPVSRVEFAPADVASVFEHRQAMLLKRQAEQEAAMKKAENEARVRTAAREKAAEANPVPANTIVIVQAEDFTGQGGGEVNVSDTKRAIIGKALLGWDAIGHWLDYTVEVPAEGYYNLTLCYCTELALCERQLGVNGEVQEPFAPLVFPSTGGWANGSDDWRLYTAPNPVAKHPLLIKLRQGKNVIRVTNLNGRGVNLDYLVVHSPDAKIDRASLNKQMKK